MEFTKEDVKHLFVRRFKKDVEAEILAINAGLKSRRQAISERGYDAEQVDAEIAADKARTDALGLSFGTPPAAKEDPTDE